MNRLLISGNIAAALELSLAEMTDSEIKCQTCPGYCENACRRKKIDQPVSIRNIKLFVSRNISRDKYPPQFPSQTVNAGVRKRFSSRIGQLEDFELREWLKECREEITRFREIVDFQSAASEAGSCMHCDCRAAESCKLRTWQRSFHLKIRKANLLMLLLQKR